MKKIQRMLNFHTYKRLFCANCYIIAYIFALKIVEKFFDFCLQDLGEISKFAEQSRDKLLADKTAFYLYELTLNDFTARTGYTSAKLKASSHFALGLHCPSHQGLKPRSLLAI